MELFFCSNLYLTETNEVPAAVARSGSCQILLARLRSIASSASATLCMLISSILGGGDLGLCCIAEKFVFV